MNMNVVYGLSTVVAGVDNGAKAFLSDTEDVGGLLHSLHHPTQQTGILHVEQARIVYFGDQQDVNGGLRVPIGKGEKLLVLINRRNGNLFGGDFAENAIIVHGVSFQSKVVDSGFENTTEKKGMEEKPKE